ncbi:MAG TPA: exodeoxyribonuclease VII large subunit [Thermoanaerobaculia bacterium]|nr:exodeoxyribonuclease VII large subunit [Thermoanaerobaculia bacterium]
MYPSPVPAAAPPRPYTVSELLSEVGQALRSSWRDISVTGEIGRFDVRGGHGYFTLRDRGGTLNGVIFGSDLKRIPFALEPGLEVVARGALDLWAPQGRFQLRAYRFDPVGVGALQLAFEQLKARLEAEGLFRRERKRPIPLLPQRIAVVTSPEGAAIRDILSILARRFDGLAVTIYPVRVQGEGSAAEVALAIAALNRREVFDVLIVARGGGSLEDLAPFNDERVARALAASRIPTISAVGHETDITICDLVADLRAATPSAAAELVVERKDALRRRIADFRRRSERALSSRLDLSRAHLKALSRAEGLLRFPYRLRFSRERVGQSRGALISALAHRPAAEASRLSAAWRALTAFSRTAGLDRRLQQLRSGRQLLEERMLRRLERQRERLRACAEKLELVGPLSVLARGYAVAYREGSRAPLLSAAAVRPGERIRIRLHEGEIRAVARETSAPVDPGPLFTSGGSTEEPQ